jgi:hypothetical protein
MPSVRQSGWNAALTHELTVLRRKVRGRVKFTNSDRLFFILLLRWFPSVVEGRTMSQALVLTT